MFSKSFSGPAPLSAIAVSALVVWCIILVPWVPYLMCMGTGMKKKASTDLLPLLALIPMCVEFLGL